MSFFIRKNNSNRNSSKFPNKRKNQNNKRINDLKPNNKLLNEEISSDSEEDINSEDNNRKRKAEEYESSEEEETPQEKKLRLAKKYLEDIERQERDKNETNFVDQSISDRLRDDILEQSGRLLRKVADNYLGANVEQIRCLKNGHKLSITCVVITYDTKYIFSASKDCSIIKWDFETNKKIITISGKIKSSKDKHLGHSAHILSMAISSDDKFLATGCVNKIIHIWNPKTMELMHTFKGHRGPVSGLAFRKGFHQLFSASFDRSVKVWNLDEMSYIETLFGHYNPIMAIDSLIRDRAITAGGRDSSVRIWKIPEESQLIFLGSNHSIDCVKLLDEQHFVSADDKGSISLWGVLKKKPLSTQLMAHGMGSSDSNWITAVAVLRNTDLIASGSSDGCVRLWKCSEDFKKLEPLLNIPVIGFVNSIEFSSDGKYLVVGVGQEHRLGRWWSLKNAKNSVLIIPFLIK